VSRERRVGVGWMRREEVSGERIEAAADEEEEEAELTD